MRAWCGGWESRISNAQPEGTWATERGRSGRDVLPPPLPHALRTHAAVPSILTARAARRRRTASLVASTVWAERGRTAALRSGRWSARIGMALPSSWQSVRIDNSRVAGQHGGSFRDHDSTGVRMLNLRACGIGWCWDVLFL